MSMNDALIVRRGGGTSLNFKVIGGTTKPTSPKENTIWVNTDTPITEWVFSAEQPTNPVEGMVWFNIGTSCPAPINAVKENGLMVYPMGCQQYIGGTWVAQAAQTYQGGKWKLWSIYIFNNGDLCNSGGFSYAWEKNGGNPNQNPSYFTIGETLKLGTPAWHTHGYHSNNTYDVTNYSKLRVDGYCVMGDRATICGSVGLNKTTGIAQEASVSLDIARSVVELDISALTGHYYFVFRYHSNAGNQTGTSEVYSIELVP